MTTTNFRQHLHASQNYLGVPLLLLALLAMVTLQIPPLLLDMLFTFNIALSLVVLLVSVYTLRPLDFRVFPTILLIATLMRLALNVASTRVVLLYGHNGGDAAGKVIEAFGNVVIGGNYVVGIVVFIILMVINFSVVTKGGGRISEVTARFTLDAMPGKQMAIDADLNAGLINQEEARTRREEVRQEADFYGAMDGASKFVRGDAVAGLMILAINIIGGVIIGLMQHGMSFADAFETYALLTIGDGLVAQIPSLILSTTAAMMVTRVSDSEEMGKQLSRQMFTSPKALSVSAAILIIMGLVPGMPHLAFLSFGSLAAFIAWKMHTRQLTEKTTSRDKKDIAENITAPQQAEARELSWDDVPQVDLLGLEIGYKLIALVDKKRNGELLDRIKGVRKALSSKIGFLIPSVHVRDNIRLPATVYRISLMGIAISEGELEPDRLLALNPGQVFGEVEGTKTTDPAYGMDAVWITKEQRETAIALGYTVVDPATVLATHLSKILDEHTHELLGFEETQKLVDKLATLSPKLAEELVPGKLTISTLRTVFQQLLIDKVPLTDLRTIGGALLDGAGRNSHPVLLAQDVRVALRRTIIDELIGMEPNVPVITLAQNLEQLLLQAYQTSQQTGQFAPDAIPLDPNVTRQLQQYMPEVTEKQQTAGKRPILLVAPQLRPLLARFARICAPELRVLSYNEIPDNRQIAVEATLG
ncbi:flagellar biosynthesis protein FlhA [Endozoicomonas ascidiicola]|uniref:flagellar biosynthesis protein FlhA n=1 Tax=Endozoicomonas ascidiicola TaxID=1698521 RepID=UPI00082A9CFD|nr:flagellar biosynthesis protein FlhA [Endozoicomonas ascidiicola]